MDELIRVLEREPLGSHQRVLAVTFMHGSRRRLENRLSIIEQLRGRYEAAVLDGFAWRLVQRWRRLVVHLGFAMPKEHDFDSYCAIAARLVTIPIVAQWVKSSFPVMIVDEAQDLCANRSTIISALSATITVILAFDEFQCLSPELRPVPIQAWLAENARPVTLQGNRRTNVAPLLAAADAVRQGLAIADGGREFRLTAAPGLPLMATWLANAVRFRHYGGSLAVLTPSRDGLAAAAVALVAKGPIGRHRSGPFNISWENSDAEELDGIWNRVALNEHCDIYDAIAALHEGREDPILLRTRDWLQNKERTLGIKHIAAEEVRAHVERLVTRRRQFGGQRDPALSAMTIHQAKNREFDHVVVIWPHRVPNGDDQRRRLLYNAITRARRSCTVLVQAQRLLEVPPFAPTPAPT
ncbi:ATP-dependent helicase [Aquidulcibacter sp.]|uniref:ATP-dependent helicase n=1 Tax=Aquidulcibacter sp. TaxID=2052990 RepID=UPI0031FEE1CD